MRKSGEGWWRGALLLAGVLMTTPLPGRAISTTTVQDVVYRADGGIAQGTLLVSWPSFTAADGSTVTAGSTTVAIAPSGALSLQLTPNEGAQPAGTYYTAVYHLSDGTVQKEYWVVPQLPTATIAMMRSKVVPAAVAQPIFNQQSLNAAVQSATANFLPLKGGALTGALNLAADPQSGLQAATKQYVDTHGVAALPSGIVFGSGGSTGRATTGADVVSLWGGTACTGFLKNDLTCATPSLALPNALVRGQGTGQPAIPAAFGDVVSLFGGGSCTGYIKSDGSCSNPTVALPNALVRGNGSSAATAATYADVTGPFHSIGAPVTTTSSVLSSTFNEAAAGAALNGTTPATCGSGCVGPWVADAGFKLVSGGGVTFSGTVASPASYATINTGHADYTVTYGLTTTTANGNQLAVRFTAPGNFVGVNVSSTLLEIYDVFPGGGGRIATLSGTFGSGTYAVSAVGNQITVYRNGSFLLLGTLFSNSGNTKASRAGFGEYVATDAVWQSIAVSYGTTTVPNVACAGYLNADGTCSAVTNDVVAMDNTGHFATLAEKQTQTTNGVTTIACDEDLGMGKFDARCAKYSGGVFGPTPAVALQSLASTLICYESQVGKAPTVYFPAGTFPVGTPTEPALVFPTGGNYYGAAGRNGQVGTIFQATYNNHNAVQFNSGQTATCSDGQVHTANLTGGNYLNISEHGCGQGGCVNVPGDNGSYPNGGPNQGGIFIGDSQGYAHNISANNNGDSGVILAGQDSVGDGLWGYGNLEWYTFGKNIPTVLAPGTGTPTGSATGGTLAAGTYFYRVTALNATGETTGSPEISVTTTGTTGSVSLTWASVAGATKYRVYRGTAAGGESVYWGGITSASFLDTNAASTAGTVPTGNTTTYNPATDGQHCQVVLGSLDGQFDHIETYGAFANTLGPEYGHLAGICWGGGYTTLDHPFVQIDEIGILSTGANQGRLSNFRLEGIEGEAIVNAGGGGGGDFISNGEIHGACTASNVLFAVGNSPVQAGLGTHCNYIDDENGGSLYSNVYMANDPFFAQKDGGGNPLYYATGGIWAPFGAQTANVVAPNIPGGVYQFPASFTPGQGAATYQLFAGGTGANVTGPAPSVANFANAITPVDRAPITYTGVTGGWTGQEFNIFVPNGNANVTLQGTNNGGHWHTCGNTGVDFNLALPGTYRYVIYPGAGAPDYYPFCSTAPAGNSSTAACGSGNIPCTNAANSFSGDQSITGSDNLPLSLSSSDARSTAVTLTNTSAGGKSYRFSSTGTSNPAGPGLFSIVDVTDNVTMVAQGFPGAIPTGLSSIEGTFYRGADVSTGGTFAVSGCAATAATGGASAGSVTSGTAGACTFTLTMGNATAAPHGWACYVNDLTTPANVLHQTATTATTATFSGTTAGADVMNFACTGY